MTTTDDWRHQRWRTVRPLDGQLQMESARMLDNDVTLAILGTKGLSNWQPHSLEGVPTQGHCHLLGAGE